MAMSAPVTPKRLTPEEQVAADQAAGNAAATASGVGAPGSFGRITDERKAEIDALLARQKAGLDGMTPQEKLAAKEQGTATINGQLATNMKQFGDIAAGNGIRGGSAAGLQMQALGQAQEASGQLSRQMILDNMAQKNIAMDRYGNTLQNQQGVGLGIQGQNNDSMRGELLAKQLYGDNYVSRLDSTRSGQKADDFTQQGLDLTRDQIKALTGNGGYSGMGGNAAGPAPVGINSTTGMTLWQDKLAKATSPEARAAIVGEWLGIDPNDHSDAANLRRNDPTMLAQMQAGGQPSRIKVDPNNKTLTDTYTGEVKTGEQAASEWERKKLEEGWIKDPNTGMIYDPETWKRMQNEANPGNTTGGNGGTIICTESHRQGFISDSEYRVTKIYGAQLTPAQYAGYLVWAAPIVRAMKASRFVAQVIGRLVKHEIKAMRAELNGKEAPLFGALVLLVVKALNKRFSR